MYLTLLFGESETLMVHFVAYLRGKSMACAGHVCDSSTVYCERHLGWKWVRAHPKQQQQQQQQHRPSAEFYWTTHSTTIKPCTHWSDTPRRSSWLVTGPTLVETNNPTQSHLRLLQRRVLHQPTGFYERVLWGEPDSHWESFYWGRSVDNLWSWKESVFEEIFCKRNM